MGERIRDKIAASKKKGMRMGGVEVVRCLFRRYLEAGSVVRLQQQLDADGVRVPVRIDGGGRSTGGGLFSRGHIYKILSNPIHVGRIAHIGQVHEGLQSPIVTQDLWNDARRTVRSIRMTLSLAFLAPEIVKAEPTAACRAALREAPRRPADGLAGSVAHARTPSTRPSGTNDLSLPVGFPATS
jgi:hypothetical protein